MESTNSKSLRWLVALVAGVFLTLAVAQFPVVDWCKFQEAWYLLVFGLISTATVIAFSPRRSLSTRSLLLIPLLLFFGSSRFTNSRASAEAGAVAALRDTSGYLQAYAAEHPSSGYPEIIAPIKCPCRSRGYYSFQYRAERSMPNGVPDRYTVIAVPVPPKGLTLRSFAATEQGRILYTTDNRPATRTDPAL